MCQLQQCHRLNMCLFAFIQIWAEWAFIHAVFSPFSLHKRAFTTNRSPCFTNAALARMHSDILGRVHCCPSVTVCNFESCSQSQSGWHSSSFVVPKHNRGLFGGTCRSCQGQSRSLSHQKKRSETVPFHKGCQCSALSGCPGTQMAKGPSVHLPCGGTDSPHTRAGVSGGPLLDSPGPLLAWEVMVCRDHQSSG